MGKQEIPNAYNFRLDLERGGFNFEELSAFVLYAYVEADLLEEAEGIVKGHIARVNAISQTKVRVEKITELKRCPGGGRTLSFFKGGGGPMAGADVWYAFGLGDDFERRLEAGQGYPPP